MTTEERLIRITLLDRLLFFKERLPSAGTSEMELVSLAWLDGAIRFADTQIKQEIILKIMEEPFEEMICTGQALLKAESHNL